MQKKSRNAKKKAENARSISKLMQKKGINAKKGRKYIFNFEIHTKKGKKKAHLFGIFSLLYPFCIFFAFKKKQKNFFKLQK